MNYTLITTQAVHAGLDREYYNFPACPYKVDGTIEEILEKSIRFTITLLAMAENNSDIDKVVPRIKELQEKYIKTN